MQNSYSLWIPVDPSAKKIIQEIINNLSKTYNGPLFEPHCTLLGDILADKRKILKTTHQLAKKLKPFEISLGEVSFSTTYFQSVFVKVKASTLLMGANLLAKKIFQVENKLFMPHVSLLYGNQKIKKREKAAKEVQLPQISFKAKSLIVTPSTPNPDEWIYLAEYHFSQ